MTKFDLMQVETTGEGIAHSQSSHHAPWVQWIRSFAERIGWSDDLPSVLIFSLSGLNFSVWLVTQTWFVRPDDFVGVLLA